MPSVAPLRHRPPSLGLGGRNRRNTHFSLLRPKGQSMDLCGRGELMNSSSKRFCQACGASKVRILDEISATTGVRRKHTIPVSTWSRPAFQDDNPRRTGVAVRLGDTCGRLKGLVGSGLSLGGPFEGYPGPAFTGTPETSCSESCRRD
jgi:hypothetical protein